MTAPIPCGTRQQLALARRAIKVARTHLSVARQGLRGSADAEALEVLRELSDALVRVARLTKTERARRAA